MIGKPEEPNEGAAHDRLDKLLGPSLTRQRVAAWLHATEAHVRDLTARGDLIALPDEGGSLRYPAFQFDRYERTLPHVAWILRLIDPKNIDPWDAAVWLNSVHHSLDGRTAAEVLRRGDCYLVLDAARAVYEQRRHE